MQGDVATLPVRELFGWLARTRASGRLSLSRGMAARRFHVANGEVMLVSASDSESRLGQLLVERRLMTQAALRKALSVPREGEARLGQTLVESGLISRTVLGVVLAESIERLLVDTLAWTDGQFHFDEAALPSRAEAIPAAVSLADVLDRPVVAARPVKGRPPVRDAVPVEDADVLESAPIAVAGASSAEPTELVTDAPTAEAVRRRKRRVAA